MKKIAIFGGTFNPVHVEHKRIVESAIEELGLDKVIVVPTNQPPHKKTELATSFDRINMLKLCFLGNEKVEISDFEITNGGTSYTYLTLEHFKNVYKDTKLFFLVGGDMLVDFKNWRNPERILGCCELAVFGREDFIVDKKVESEIFKSKYNKSFLTLKYQGKKLSSTEIRILSALGLSLEGKVEPKVEKYIIDNDIYSLSDASELVKKTLPKKRLVHTALVTVCALKKAKELNLDREKVITACLLHDVAKYIDYKTVDGFLLPKGVPEPVIHAFLGAYIAENHLKIQDQEVIDAIRYHTSGKAKMSDLAKLLFVADMIEPGRDYEGVEYLRSLYETDFEKCFRECIKEETVHLINKKAVIYEETLNAYEYYINQKN